MTPDTIGDPRSRASSEITSAARLEDRVLDILATVTETSEVRHRPHLELFDSGLLDSLKTVELIVAMSDTFGVQLTPSEFDRDEWSTPRHIVDYMQRRIGV